MKISRKKLIPKEKDAQISWRNNFLDSLHWNQEDFLGEAQAIRPIGMKPKTTQMFPPETHVLPAPNPTPIFTFR
jgi:hypothetical protein